MSHNQCCSEDGPFIVTYWNGQQHVKVMSHTQFWVAREFATRAEADAFVDKYDHFIEKMRVIRPRK